MAAPGAVAEPVVRVDSLVFEYPGKRVLHNVSFAIERGTITALVGPNGAGKTTLLRCVAGLARPFAGSVAIDGMVVERQPRECHRRLGYLSDFFGLYEDLTVRQCLIHRAAAQGLAAEAIDGKAALAAERLAIDGFLGRKAGTLSRGERQRLAIAQAIVHEPGIVLLDEPASGLDPEARWSLSNLLIALRGQGMTLVVSSHILAELEDYSTDLLILRDGAIVEHRPIGATAHDAICVRIELGASDERLEAVLRGFDGVTEVAVHGLVATVVLDAAAGYLEGLLRHVVDAGLPVRGFVEDRSRMQEIYLARLGGEDDGGESGA